jgi:hypothetical protein
VEGTNAVVGEPLVWTKLGEDVELHCSSSQPKLTECRWTKESNSSSKTRTAWVRINSRNEIIDRTGEGEYEFAGGRKEEGNEGGLEQGQCGLRVKNISISQIGLWGCTLIGKDVWIGTVHVPLIGKTSLNRLSLQNFKKNTL